MTTPRDSHLVSVDWLAAHLTAPDVVVVDASWHLPTSNRDAHAEYLAGHIPGAVFFDIDRIADVDSGLPHMLPRPEVFASRMRKMGIGDGQKIVVYDSLGLFSAPRVWWTFKVMGVSDVAILDGGLPAWIAVGHEVESGPVMKRDRHFTARLDNSAVRDFDAMQAILASGSARWWTPAAPPASAARRRNRAPASRAAHARRRQPAFRPTGRERPPQIPQAIRDAFQSRGVDLSQPIVTSCGSGVTAAVLTLALETAGARNVSLYDGSWSEWGGKDGAAVVTGE